MPVCTFAIVAERKSERRGDFRLDGTSSAENRISL